MVRTPKQLWQDALAGVIAGLVFTIVYSSFPLMFLPALMLMLAGLSSGTRSSWIAGLCACLAVEAALGTQGAIFFGSTLVLPSAYFVQHALLWREGPKGREWYPIERILTQLTLLAVGFFMTFALLITKTEQESLQDFMAHGLHDISIGGPPEVADMARHILTDWSFLLFAVAGWMWVLLLYAFAVAANHILVKRHRELRRDLALSWRGVPHWLLGLVILTALLACFGTGNDRYCAQASFLMLLLPYFLVGMAKIHAAGFGRDYRSFWLTALYAALVMLLPWTVLAVVIAGLYIQIREWLDKPRKIG